MALDAPTDFLQCGVAFAGLAQTPLDGRDALRQRDHVDLAPLDVGELLADQRAFGAILVQLGQARDTALQGGDLVGQLLRAPFEQRQLLAIVEA